VFSNGGLLFSVAFPGDSATPASYYVGMGQIYYGHPFVRRIRAIGLSSDHRE
jgi:hypothetical protein